MAVLNCPLDVAPTRRQVHDVVLVDPRRAAQKRDLKSLLGLRFVLDELHELVAKHDLARRGRQALSHLERRGVDLSRQALVVSYIVEEIPEPARNAGPPGIESLLQR